VRREDAREYVKLMEEIALPDYRGTPGNIGAWCLHRDLDDRTEIVMLTFWEDMDAIRRFAGDGETVAKYYDFDTDYLIDMPEEALHFSAIGPSAD
jgi:heme-degrading monooxygenase HmoA